MCAAMISPGAFFHQAGLNSILFSSLLSCLFQIHGALNAIGWGVLLPLGAMIARYLKPFTDPAWYYLHGSLQLSGYIIGIVGFGYGIKLMSNKLTHRKLAYTILTLGTLQVCG